MNMVDIVCLWSISAVCYGHYVLMICFTLSVNRRADGTILSHTGSLLLSLLCYMCIQVSSVMNNLASNTDRGMCFF